MRECYYPTRHNAAAPAATLQHSSETSAGGGSNSNTSSNTNPAPGAGADDDGVDRGSITAPSGDSDSSNNTHASSNNDGDGSVIGDGSAGVGSSLNGTTTNIDGLTATLSNASRRRAPALTLVLGATMKHGHATGRKHITFNKE